MSIPAKLTAYLKARKLPFQVVEHKTVFTAYDLAQTLKVKLNEIAKTLLLKVRDPKPASDDPKLQPGSHHFLAVVPAHFRVDLQKVKKLLGAKQVSIASESEMTKTLKQKAGSQTPFGSFHKLQVVMDKTLLKTSQALFGAGSFTESLRLKVKDYHRAERPITGDIAEKKKKR